MKSSVQRRVVALLAVLMLLFTAWAVVLASPVKEGGRPFELKVRDGKFSLRADNAPLGDILRELEAMKQLQLQVDPRLPTRITANLKDVTLEEMLERLSSGQALVYEKRGDSYVLVEASLASKQDRLPPSAESAGAEVTYTDPTKPWLLSNAGKPLKELRQRGARAILLQNAVIDTEQIRKTGRPFEVPEPFRAGEGTERYIVQFDHAVSEADRAALEQAGAQISHYVPNGAYAVKLRASQKDAVAGLPGVMHVEAYHPYFKMNHDVLTYVTHQADEQSTKRVEDGVFNVMGFRGTELDALNVAGAEVLGSQNVDGRQVLTVRVPSEHLAEVAALESVQWIEPRVSLQALNDLANRRVRAVSFKSAHPTLKGEGVTVALTDSGIDFENASFAIDQSLPTSTGLNSRISYYEARTGGFTADGLPGDNNGHGTHVAGTILGNGAQSDTVLESPGSGEAPFATNAFAGIAPEARIVVLEDFNSFTDTEQAETAYGQGARISNNSWGNTLFEYGSLSAIWDALVRDADTNAVGDQEYIAIFAAGNSGNGLDDGSGGVPGTVGEPGNAKNVISVGAVEQPRFADNILGVNITVGTNIVKTIISEDETDSDWQIAAFSSRGPVTDTDVRFKPDIVAPGAYVLSVQSHETNPDELIDALRRDYRDGNVNSGTNYAFNSGTSMATPVVAGAAALIYEYFTNTFARAPSPAMVKAMLVSGARMLNSLKYNFSGDSAFTEIVDQGFGLVDIMRSIHGPRIHDTDEILLLDQSDTTPVGTEEVYQRQITVNPGEGSLKIALAWTDPAGTPGNSFQLVNDIDLIVFAPGGGGYLGNQFGPDLIHSQKYTEPDPNFGDEYNNVEMVVIRNPPTGTYTIQVRGYQVPEGPQNFALAIMKGVGIEGRVAGDTPDIALDTNDAPIIVYADIGPEATILNRREIYVRRWAGPYGDASDLGLWRRMDDQWFNLRDSAERNGISRTIGDSHSPSVAAFGNKAAVAWVESAQGLDTTTPDRIYLREFDGNDWVQLSGSAQDFGVSGVQTRDAAHPTVRYFASGLPAVAWEQKILATTRVHFAYFDGVTNWLGFGGSHTNGVPGATAASDPDMILDSVGRPVVAWLEQTASRIFVRRWSGASWVDMGAIGQPLASNPRLAAGNNGDFYLAYIQSPTGGTNLTYQVHVARNSGGVWSQLAGSTNSLGISANTNLSVRPVSLSIGAQFNNVVTNIAVAYQFGSNDVNSVLVRRFAGSSWQGLGGSEAFPGVGLNDGVSTLPDIVVDTKGLPLVSFQNTGSGTNEVLTYTIVSDRSPPTFAGLQTAIGGTNGVVNLSWLPAVDDISTTIVYAVYRGTQTTACGSSPNCNVGDVFSNLVGVTVNSTNFTVTGLVNNVIYCFGVRAIDTNGLEDANTVTKSAGPVSGAGDNDADCLDNIRELLAGTEPCIKDTDGDDMWDGWEWTYSTNNPLHPSFTNPAALHLDPLDNGLDNVRTVAANDGDLDQLPFADIDGDGAANIEEFQWWFQFTLSPATNCGPNSPTNRVSPNPTLFDTDNDGIPDGWEIFNQLTATSSVNPTVSNSPTADADGDGVPDIIEFQHSADPNNRDTDGDGLNDSNEYFVVGTGLATADTDRDGLDDGFELTLGANPLDADSNDSGVNDGDVYQLGMNPTSAVANFRVFINESFETSSRTNWVHYAPNGALPFDFWHLSTAEPNPKTNAVLYLNDHSTNTAYRAANDPSKTNVNASYSIGSALIMALQAPTLTNSETATNLFVAWNEVYETEPNFDQVLVQARSSGNTNWFLVGVTRTGKSGIESVNTNEPAIWIHSVADLSAFAGKSNVQVRFLFQVLNNINNQFKGWWVDDVRIYEGTTINGWVRDNNGRAIEGAVVRALGRGGVTNIVQGHAYVNPGRIFGEAVSLANGRYELRGLPQGNFYVKASAAGHISEFSDGMLFTGVYAFASGFRPGVTQRDSVTSNGVYALLSEGVITNVFFELERGGGRGCLGMMHPNAAGATFGVQVDGVSQLIWNGFTNGSAGTTNYLTSTNTTLLDNHPDWLTNAVQPTLLCDLAPGEHLPYAGTNLVLYPLPQVILRDGEITLLSLATNQAGGRLFVDAEDGRAYAVRVDGRTVTNLTPALLSVRAGLHRVTLIPTGTTAKIAPREVTVPIGGRASVVFTTNDITGSPGVLWISTKDVNGNAVTGATVYVNGLSLTTNDVSGASLTTPVVVTSLRPGNHRITLTRPGYQQTENRLINVFAGVTNIHVILMYDADMDYDRVGDATEVGGYTNIFLFHRENDPDGDGLSNLAEFDLVRLFNVLANAFSADSDADGMLDGQETGYDGLTNRFALSSLYTNVLQDASSVQALFVGQYLAGIDNFGSNLVAVSIEGDRFEGYVTHPLLVVPTPEPALTVFTNIQVFPTNVAVNAGHAAASLTFADGRPDVIDTDADGMWDGFESAYGLGTIALLDVIEAGREHDDSDFDGLDNIFEFQGPDAVANTNDWSNPTLADSDGDFIPDGWEYQYGFDPNDPADAFADPDGDGLVNLGEFFAGTVPTLADTDADFLNDFQEVVIYGSNPLAIDTDFDGLLDGREVWDRNLDGVQDGGFFPNWSGGDLDNDGLIDGPTDWDTDGDGMPDGFEVIDNFGNLRDPALNPYDPTDGDDDSDGDGLSNLQEFLVRDSLFGNNPVVFGAAGVVWDYSSDPFQIDSDGDGLPDGFEVDKGLHPVDPIPCQGGEASCTRYSILGPGGDPDGDGLWNDREFRIRFYLSPTASSNALDSLSTHPWDPDTDKDGLGDGEEDRAFRSHPILQDTEADRLFDGAAVTGRFSEVESQSRSSVFFHVVGATNFGAAYSNAQVSHAAFFGSPYTNIIGHLAVFSDPLDFLLVVPPLGLVGTNIAIGATNSGANAESWEWLTYEDFYGSLYTFSDGSVNSSFVAGVSNGLVMDSAGTLSALDVTNLVDSYLIEWDDVPTVTNHYDMALNDMWRLVWPGIPDNNLPYWEKVVFHTNSVVPPARWSAAMSYIPVFETKNPRDDNSGQILMDNRQLVLIGGRDGVHRHKDVWEFVIRSNSWVLSEAPLNNLLPGFVEGLSESIAVPVFGYKNTKANACPCTDVPYDCNGTDFNLPKNRPFSDSRSFDWTYIYGGWDETHAYYPGWFTHFYHSTDSQDPIVEKKVVDASVIQIVNTTGGRDIRDSLSLPLGIPYEPLGQPGNYPIDNTGSNTVLYVGTNAAHFGSMAVRSGCERILKAELLFHFYDAPSPDLTINVYAEIGLGGNSSADYADGLPSTRVPPNFTVSPTLVTNLPAGQKNPTVDVTDLVLHMQTNGWVGDALGFVISAPGAAQAPRLTDNTTEFQMTYVPSYRSDPLWSGPSLVVCVNDECSFGQRKSVGLSWDYGRQRMVLFGGINGNVVYGDTHDGEFEYTGSYDPKTLTWTKRSTAVSPPARWGHSMVYDAKNERTLMFGGFDKDHKPLNDLWAYTPFEISDVIVTNISTNGVTTNTVSITNDAAWVQLTGPDFRDDQIPQPRGGASMIYWGDFDYSRGIGDYCVGANKQKIVLFGGTDGKSYFNDTWVYHDENDRWVLCSPNGEHSASPPPRAFAAMVFAQNASVLPDLKGDATFERDTDPPSPCSTPSAFLFGGRRGTLTTGHDTDFDLVDDGTEHELGGPLAGRDPRLNALIDLPITTTTDGTNIVVTTNNNETIPFAFKRLGSVTPSLGLLRARGAIANFESFRHEATPDINLALQLDVPFEQHPDQWTQSVLVGYPLAGVDAVAPDQTALWYHRYSIEDPHDPLDVWDLGRPDNTVVGTNGAPPYAYSGRWVYGTDLNGNYPNNAVMELYSPIFDLSIPPLDSTSTNYLTSYFLVFHEWLHLADSNDMVRVDVVRPETPADILTRVSGLSRPPITIVPNRNNAANTTGTWRRVIVPLDLLGNQSNLYVRFTLQSDSNLVAGGWYLDDFAVLQASEICGTLTGSPSAQLVLLGTNFNNNVQASTYSDTNGFFKFGFLPLGDYQLGGMGGTLGGIVLDGTEVCEDLGVTNLPDLVITNIVGLTTKAITWPSSPGVTYRIEYTTDIMSGIWTLLDTVIAGDISYTYVDFFSDPARIYRVVGIPAP